jgi:hypothetical protein
MNWFDYTNQNSLGGVCKSKKCKSRTKKRKRQFKKKKGNLRNKENIKSKGNIKRGK